jgi:hypothetical protein
MKSFSIPLSTSFTSFFAWTQVSNIPGSTGRVLPPLLGSACPAAPLHPGGGGEGQEDHLWSVGSLCPLPTVSGRHGSRWTVKRYINTNYTLVCECRAFS